MLEDPKRLQINLDGIESSNYQKWKTCLENVKNLDFKGILLPLK